MFQVEDSQQADVTCQSEVFRFVTETGRKLFFFKHATQQATLVVATQKIWSRNNPNNYGINKVRFIKLINTVALHPINSFGCFQSTPPPTKTLSPVQLIFQE